MIIIDSHESPEYYRILSQSIPCETQLINQLPGQIEILPDLMIYNGGKAVGGNHKQIGEFIGGLDLFEDQIQREVAGDLDYLFIWIDGMVTCDDDGSCQTWRKGTSKTVWVPGHHYNIAYNRIAQVIDRCWQLGVPVLRPAGVWEACKEIEALHTSIGKQDWEHHTFNRFIKSKFFINRQNADETDEEWMARRAFIETLIGIRNAGLGEEAAVAISNYFVSMYDLMEHLKIDSVSQYPMESGRKIGGSIDGKLRKALGVPG